GGAPGRRPDRAQRRHGSVDLQDEPARPARVEVRGPAGAALRADDRGVAATARTAGGARWEHQSIERAVRLARRVHRRAIDDLGWAWLRLDVRDPRARLAEDVHEPAESEQA